MRAVVLPIFVFMAAAFGAETPRVDVATIIQRATEATERNWQAAPEFDYFERDRLEKGTKTYRVQMILGSPYQRLVKVDDQPLPADEDAAEQRKLNDETARRRAESPDERAKRVADYQRERERDHVLIEQLTKAFDFRSLGKQRLGGRQVYVLQATPRAGYDPPNLHARVLPGMRGKLWIDTETFQWVRVEAEVTRPVSIVGFLARVQPGTKFELEYSPVTDDIWLPNHFAMRSHAKILFLFSRRDHADESYFGYERAAR